MGRIGKACALVSSPLAALVLLGHAPAARASSCLAAEGSCSAVGGQGPRDGGKSGPLDSREHVFLQLGTSEAQLKQKQGSEQVAAAECCGKCGGGSFCSPVSQNCYHAKLKEYYVPCGGQPVQPVSPTGCAPSQIQRRRRATDMCSCRRRSGASGLTPGWSCGGGDVIAPCNLTAGECKVAVGEWCNATVPPLEWNLTQYGGSGGMRVKALTYNLFWWRLFGQLGGNGGSAGRLVREAAGDEPFDVAAFQECDDPRWIMGDAQMSEQQYSYVRWGSNTLAYRKTRWSRLADGVTRTSEDRWDQWYGRRGVHWVRLAEKSSNRTLFVMNHHGPLPVNTGGKCGAEATAYNMLEVVKQHSQPDDALVLTGDFNADEWSYTVQTLGSRINKIVSHWVDHFFSNANESSVVQTKNLGSGGSDHDAMMAIFDF